MVVLAVLNFDMRNLKLILAVSFLIFATGQICQAQSSSPFNIELKVSPDKVLVGETFDVILHLEYTSDLGQVQVPQPEFPDLADFEKVGTVGFSERQNMSTNSVTGQIQSQASYDFTRTYKALKGGEFEIPGVDITIKDPAQPSGELKIKTKGVKITVLDIAVPADKTKEKAEEKPKEEEGIRDIKDPIPAPQWILYVVGAGGLAILLGFALLLTRFVKPRAVASVQQAEMRKIVDPYERAIFKLKQIKIPGTGAEDDQITVYYIRLTDIVKEYLGTKHNVMGFEATSYEITESMRMVYKKCNRGDELIVSLEKFLAELDLGKYAKAHRDESFMKNALTRAKEFIQLDHSIIRPIQVPEEKAHA
jgi:hypothetical protein